MGWDGMGKSFEIEGVGPLMSEAGVRLEFMKSIPRTLTATTSSLHYWLELKTYWESYIVLVLLFLGLSLGGVQGQGIWSPPSLRSDGDWRVSPYSQATSPQIEGRYLGQFSSNPYAPNSTATPYGPFGSPYAPLSTQNPYGTSGSRYGAQSAHDPYSSRAPRLYDSRGHYRGRLISNPYAPDSISNPYGRYGSPYSPDSVNNPYGAGSPYRYDSPNNPYGQRLMIWSAP